jgi:hypothetical protein
MYLQEVYDLVDSLLYRLSRLEDAAARWLSAHREVDDELSKSRDEFDVDAFNDALRRSGHEQSTVFDEVEAFLAAWARLSLLFWPAPMRSAKNHDYTVDRGARLAHFLRLSDDHQLKDRDLRNAWMHTDERFDDAWLDGRLGNRQQFVRTAEVDRAIAHAVRVLDVESLTMHFRNADGSVGTQPLRQLKGVLEELLARRQAAFRERFAELPDHVT